MRVSVVGLCVMTAMVSGAASTAESGAEKFGTAPPANIDIGPLVGRIARLWSPDCAAKGANLVQVKMRFTISPNGQVIQGPEWVNQHDDAVWWVGAERAKNAILAGQPFTGLPAGMYGRPMAITFDAINACKTK